MPSLHSKSRHFVPIALGLVVSLVIGGGIATIGMASGWEAHTHLNSILPSVRFLASTVIAATATILSLLLAFISFSQTMKSKRRLRGAFFHQIRILGRAATVTLIGATLILSLISIPIEESDKMTVARYTAVYYVILTAVALLSGLLTFTISYLYRCMSNLIDLVHPEFDPEDHPWVAAGDGSRESEGRAATNGSATEARAGDRDRRIVTP